MEPSARRQQALPRSAGRGRDGSTASGHSDKHRTACFNCRTLRQRCDRQQPCSRCASQSRPCTYPACSNRGRKLGSTNKPVAVEKLLSRLNETDVREQVIAALAKSHLVDPRMPTTPTATPAVQLSAPPPTPLLYSHQDGIEYDIQHSLVSPLDMMAAAVTADTTTQRGTPSSQTTASLHGQLSRTASAGLVDERLASYFAPQATHQRDWQVLASQSIDSTLKLDPSASDPITSRIIDLGDASHYFDLFFKLRNPLLGILDPVLHTPDYVYSTSFTLFSTICALGCAVSRRTRDRVLYPVLLSLAEADVKWSIANSVKSLETIQAIMCMQYWAPISRRQSDDPSWLRLSHAVQIAREMGIHRPAAISAQVNASTSPTDSPSFKERLLRNFERTWLYTFIADKSFGITVGRYMGVSWKEIPASASDWWRKPMTSPIDRVISGIIEMRGILLHALAKRKRGDINNTPASIFEWHSQTFSRLETMRQIRCAADELPSARSLPALAFYVDHSILILNAEAIRDLVALEESNAPVSVELATISKRSVDVASRLLYSLLNDEFLLELFIGFHNNQYIMICHAATEILHAIKRGCLSSKEVSEATAKVMAIPEHLGKAAQELPASSAVHLYLSLARFFASQFNKIVGTGHDQAEGRTGDQGDAFSEWWRVLDGGPLDSATWFDMGFLGSEQPAFDLNSFESAEQDLDSYAFS